DIQRDVTRHAAPRIRFAAGSDRAARRESRDRRARRECPRGGTSNASREEQRARPRRPTPLVQDAVVAPVRIARPALNRLRHKAETGPERRARNRGALEPIAVLTDALIEHGALL